MKLLRKIISVVGSSNGRALWMTIPAAFAREMGLKKGNKADVVYDPDSNSINVSKRK